MKETKGLKRKHKNDKTNVEILKTIKAKCEWVISISQIKKDKSIHERTDELSSREKAWLLIRKVKVKIEKHVVGKEKLAETNTSDA